MAEAGAGFLSVTEAIDTTTTPGRMMMHMVGAFAELSAPGCGTTPGPASSHPAGRI